MSSKAAGGWLLAAMAMTGCYQGLAVDVGPGEGTSGGVDSAVSSSGEGDETGTGTGGVPVDDPSQCGDVAFSPFERLNAGDYRRTVRSLFPLIELPDPPLPDDEAGAGAFTSNILAQIDATAVRRYATASNEIAAAVVADIGQQLPCYDSADVDDACVVGYILELADRAYRRPLSPEQRAGLEAFYTDARAEFGPEAALESTISSLLQSPLFLYHVELGGADPVESDEVLRLDGYEVASRLSYFLWGTMPDAEAFAAAASGALDTPEGVAEQALRMLEHPAARAVVSDFHTQLMGVESLETFIADEGEYPQFDEALRAEMAMELERFSQWQVLDNEGTFSDLMTASESFVGPRLAEIYGAEVDETDPWATPVALDPRERAGILTQSAFLTSHADRFRGSPIRRGVLVRDRFLCGELPPPPADIPALPEVDPDTTSVRALNNQHEIEACQGCHLLINPLGFAFLGYDSLGGRLALDGEGPVDESGELHLTDVDGPFVGATELADRLAQSEMAQDCFVRNWTRFALGRDAGAHGGDACSLSWLQEEFAASGGHMKSLLLAIAETRAFTHRRLDMEE